jgi:putative oxidoreductase
MDALILIRVVFGLLMAGHGAQKLFGWLGGYGLEGTGGFFEGLGFRPGKLFAAAAGTGEFTGGLFVAFGLLGPIGPALILSVMLVAYTTVHHGKGLFAATGGIEVPALYSAAAATLALAGPGAYALDNVLGLTPLWTPEVRLIALGVGILGAVANLAIRRPAPQAVSA